MTYQHQPPHRRDQARSRRWTPPSIDALLHRRRVRRFPRPPASPRSANRWPTSATLAEGGHHGKQLHRRSDHAAASRLAVQPVRDRVAEGRMQRHLLRDGDELHLFGEMHFSTEGEAEDGREVNLLTLLQGKLQQLDAASYPRIRHPRRGHLRQELPGELRRVRLRHHSRRHPLHVYLGMASRRRRVPIRSTGVPIRIEVRGGVVQDVANLPPGWSYEIVDHDDLESRGEADAAEEA